MSSGYRQTTIVVCTNISCNDTKKGGIDENNSDVENLPAFYKNVEKVRKERFIQLEQTDVQHPFLTTKMKPYQEDAVRWMLQREKIAETAEILHPLFVEIKLSSGITIYFNKYTGYIDSAKPIVNTLRTGGILADATGLGKTVEVIACILLSPKPDTSSRTLMLTHDLTTTPKSNKRKFVLNHQNSNECCTRKKLKIAHSASNNIARDHSSHDLETFGKQLIGGETIMFCICGSNRMTLDAVQCVDCLQYRHGSCIHYRKELGDYRCPRCWAKRAPIESSATLIVCPALLQRQWFEEITKNVTCDLKICVYEGFYITPIYPTEFVNYDIVVTTYSVLQSESRYAQVSKIPSLRHPRRYASQGSPLSCIKWWRICLDEAQMVGSSSRLYMMAKKLSAQHRWAITSTPITRNLSGLFGLIEFLNLVPYNDHEIWKNLLYLPYRFGNVKPMFSCLAEIMWRSSKEEVINQMNLPSLTIKDHTLEFSAIERFFYKREHNISATEFRETMRRLNVDQHTPLKSLDRIKINEVMGPLLSIRQACNNANTVRGRYLVTPKQVTSMKDLLDALITKNLNCCNDNLRTLVCVLNGLAGVGLLANNPGFAATEYRKVLALSERFDVKNNDKEPTIDILQRVHAAHNLATVLETWPLIKSMAQEHSLRSTCLNLEQTYLEKYINQSHIAFVESETATQRVAQISTRFTLNPREWYSRILNWISVHSRLSDFNNQFCRTKEQPSSFLRENQLLHAICTWENQVSQLRQRVNVLLKEMHRFENGKLIIPESLVHDAIRCHVCTSNNTNSDKCLLCTTSECMNEYEAKLFGLVHGCNENGQKDIENTSQCKETWIELSIRALLAFAEKMRIDKVSLKDGKIYVNMLDAMKKEFKFKHAFWISLNQHVTALHEINACKVRIHFEVPGQHNEDRTTFWTLSNQTKFSKCIRSSELNYRETILREEELRSATELEKNLGTYKYLETLREQQYSGQKSDPCPVCHCELLDHWSILPCGHSYCLECMDALIKRVSAFVRLNVTCSVCRQLHRTADVAYIHTNTESKSINNKIKIKGDYSTKVEAIVKLIVALRNEESDVKILVFSAWNDVLSIIHGALELNGINSEIMHSYNYKHSLNNFKDVSKHVTALLLPLQISSKGVNLMVATHTIFVEPSLSPVDELEAIGSIHRMGQTKATTVHRFIVKNTVEENIGKDTSSNAELWSSSNLSLGHISNLFDIKEIESIT